MESNTAPIDFRITRGLALVALVALFRCGVQAPAAHAQQGTNASPHVEIKGDISQNVVVKGERLRFFVSVMNQTRSPLQLVRLNVRADGFKILSRSWCTASGPAWSSDENSSAEGPSPRDAVKPTVCVLSDEVRPGETVLASGEMLAESVREKENLIAEVQWNMPKREAPDGDLIVLGQCEIVNRFQRWRSSSSTYDLLKDFALPLALLVLGTALGFYDKHREKRRERLEKQLEDARKESAELRAQKAQTWNSMLPESHRLATDHYMPVEGAAVSFLDEFSERKKAIASQDETKKRASEDRSLYYAMLLHRRLRELANDKGGWYFKNRLAEELATALLENFRTRFLYSPVDVQSKLSLAVGVVAPREKFGPFQVKLWAMDADGALLREVRQHYKQWLESDNCEVAVRNLRAMRLLLSYEMNRPYLYWYGNQEKMVPDQESEEAIMGAAADLDKGNPTPSFVGRAKDYLTKAKAGSTGPD